MSFSGTHRNVLDKKGRLVIPSAFRKSNTDDVLNRPFWVTPEKEGCLIVRPDHEWHRYKSAVKRLQVPLKEKREYLRALNGTTERITLLQQSRMMIAPRLRTWVVGSDEYENLEVVILGEDEHFEIMHPDAFEGDLGLIEKLREYSSKWDDVISEEYL